jgi:hypothetical protein
MLKFEKMSSCLPDERKRKTYGGSITHYDYASIHCTEQLLEQLLQERQEDGRGEARRPV